MLAAWTLLASPFLLQAQSTNNEQLPASMKTFEANLDAMDRFAQEVGVPSERVQAAVSRCRTLRGANGKRCSALAKYMVSCKKAHGAGCLRCSPRVCIALTSTVKYNLLMGRVLPASCHYFPSGSTTATPCPVAAHATFRGLPECGDCNGTERVNLFASNGTEGGASSSEEESSSGSKLSHSSIISVIALVLSVILAIIGFFVTLVTYFRTSKHTTESDRDNRLRALDAEWYEKVQPAIAYLLRITNAHSPGALWIALEDKTLRGREAPDVSLGYKLDNMLDNELQVRNKIEQSRAIIMGFWIRLITSIEHNQLPHNFGKKLPVLKWRVNRILNWLGRPLQLSDEIIDLVDYRTADGSLPRNSHLWVRRANLFRTVVEPFDIAKWYMDPLDTRDGKVYSDGRNNVYAIAEAALFRELWKNWKAKRPHWAAVAAAAVGSAPVHPHGVPAARPAAAGAAAVTAGCCGGGGGDGSAPGAPGGGRGAGDGTGGDDAPPPAPAPAPDGASPSEFPPPPTYENSLVWFYAKEPDAEPPVWEGANQDLGLPEEIKPTKRAWVPPEDEVEK